MMMMMMIFYLYTVRHTSSVQATRIFFPVQSPTVRHSAVIALNPTDWHRHVWPTFHERSQSLSFSHLHSSVRSAAWYHECAYQLGLSRRCNQNLLLNKHLGVHWFVLLYIWIVLLAYTYVCLRSPGVSRAGRAEWFGSAVDVFSAIMILIARLSQLTTPGTVAELLEKSEIHSRGRRRLFAGILLKVLIARTYTISITSFTCFQLATANPRQTAFGSRRLWKV